MKLSIPLDKMTTEDKLEKMEILWADLCKHADSLSSPDWHKNILASGEQALQEGKESILDWSEAKKSIRNSIE